MGLTQNYFYQEEPQISYFNGFCSVSIHDIISVFPDFSTLTLHKTEK